VKGRGHAPDDAYEQVGETGQGDCTAHLEIRNFLGRGTPRLLIYLYPAGWTSTSDPIDGRTAPAITVSPMRPIFARLLQESAPTAAAEVSRVLRRDEEARIDHPVLHDRRVSRPVAHDRIRVAGRTLHETVPYEWRPTMGRTSVVVATDIFFVDFQLGVI
jgi:hypothetical protein